MGVRGLTSYIAKQADKFFEPYQLHDTYLIIDGNNLAMQMYRWHCNCYDCFGGDYDKYANKIKQFFRYLKECNITPLVLFDGGYENKKLITLYARIKDRIHNAKKLNSSTEGSVKVFPLFIRQLFCELLITLDIQCVRCYFEADNEIACLAKALNCPVLSYDSDFFISDVLYIPFNTLDLKVNQANGIKYMPCNIYRVENLLKSFGGLDKSLVPLIGVLLGNDYVNKSEFNSFYSQLKLPKKKHSQSEQQRVIHALINWLRSETFESAVKKVLYRSKKQERKKLASHILEAADGYRNKASLTMKYFKIDIKLKEEERSTGLELNIDDLCEKTEDLCCNQEEECEDGGELKGNDGEGIQLDPHSVGDENTDHQDKEDNFESANQVEDTEAQEDEEIKFLPLWFRDKYRKCVYPPHFVDFALKNQYFVIPQLEDYSKAQSHTESYEIISSIHKILSLKPNNKFSVIGRQGTSVKSFPLVECEQKLPKLEDIENSTQEDGKTLLYKILKLPDNFDEYLQSFPTSWRLYMIGIEYWIKTVNPAVCHIYSLILCVLMLNVADKEIGMHRSAKKYEEYFNKNYRKEESQKSNQSDENCDKNEGDESKKIGEYDNKRVEYDNKEEECENKGDAYDNKRVEYDNKEDEYDNKGDAYDDKGDEYDDKGDEYNNKGDEYCKNDNKANDNDIKLDECIHSNGSNRNKSENTLGSNEEVNKLQIKNNTHIQEALGSITKQDCFLFVKELISYFHMDPKLVHNPKLFDISIIDVFARFQSILFHITYLNTLLNNPFESFLISEFYNGTFIYNACYNFSKRTDLKSYMNLLLKTVPNILVCFSLIVDLTTQRNTESLSIKQVKKRRKKKAKGKQDVCEEIQENCEVSDDDAVLDVNNRFSMLQLKE